MPELELRWGFAVHRLCFPDEWSVGIGFSHMLEENYILISLLVWQIAFGKMKLEKKHNVT